MTAPIIQLPLWVEPGLEPELEPGLEPEPEPELGPGPELEPVPELGPVLERHTPPPGLPVTPVSALLIVLSFSYTFYLLLKNWEPSLKYSFLLR